jgi:hypothetical protein
LTSGRLVPWFVLLSEVDRKKQMVLTVVGVGQEAIPSSLTRSMARVPGLTIILRYSTLAVAKLHFSR